MSRQSKKLIRKAVATAIALMACLIALMMCLSNEGVLAELGAVVSGMTMLVLFHHISRICEIMERREESGKENTWER